MMNLRNLGAGIVLLLIVLGGVWFFMISSYEEDLGTKNEYLAVDSVNNVTMEKNNSLFDISFSNSEESLEWSKLSVSIDNGTERMACSKGNFTSNEIGKSKIAPKLSSDGVTFTVTVDATSEDDFTYLDLSNLLEGSVSNFNLRFSKTDIYLSENVTGTIIDDVNFEDLINVPNQEFTENSDERLDWYDYKITTHRVEPEDKIYVINNNGNYFEIKFLSYYNDEDEPRYVSFLVSALEDSDFPALSNPLIVSPAKCTIIESTFKSDFWEQDETIMRYENNFGICSDNCTIKIFITYENILVKGTQTIFLS
ncbi:MAG: HmuY family protein [Candidatus Poseidoniia archaeon]|nr:HmuY family protein [Candidatus Poseidoniia archaeon]